MAKKLSGAKTSAPSTGRADLPVSRGEGEAAQQRRPTTKLKSSALLDTRVVYCGDNLELPGQIQKEKGRMMKPAHSPILHLAFFHLNLPVPASHYVKVMLDQIFGKNNFTN